MNKQEVHIRKKEYNIGMNKKVDYLLYLLLDAIMENFFITIEAEESKVEELINLSKSNLQIRGWC